VMLALPEEYARAAGCTDECDCSGDPTFVQRDRRRPVPSNDQKVAIVETGKSIDPRPEPYSLLMAMEAYERALTWVTGDDGATKATSEYGRALSFAEAAGDFKLRGQIMEAYIEHLQDTDGVAAAAAFLVGEGAAAEREGAEDRALALYGRVREISPQTDLSYRIATIGAAKLYVKQGRLFPVLDEYYTLREAGTLKDLPDEAKLWLAQNVLRNRLLECVTFLREARDHTQDSGFAARCQYLIVTYLDTGSYREHLVSELAVLRTRFPDRYRGFRERVERRLGVQ